MKFQSNQLFVEITRIFEGLSYSRSNRQMIGRILTYICWFVEFSFKTTICWNFNWTKILCWNLSQTDDLKKFNWTFSTICKNLTDIRCFVEYYTSRWLIDVSVDSMICRFFTKIDYWLKLYSYLMLKICK